MRDASGAPSRTHVVLVLTLGAIWGMNWSAVRIGLSEIGPWTLRAIALCLASAILIALALGRGRSLKVKRSQWWRVAAPGFLAIAVPNVLNAYAQLYGPTGRIAIVAFTMPIWATLFARIFLGEVLDRRRLAGLVLGTTGLLALGYPLIAGGDGSIGVVMAFVTAVSWAAGTVLIKRFPIDAPPIAAATWQIVVGTALVVAGMVVFEGVSLSLPLSTPVLVAVLYQALLGQAMGTWIWFEMLGKIPASTAALGIMTVPAIGVLGALVVLGEQPTAMDCLGLALVTGASAAVLIRTTPVIKDTRSK